MAISIDNLVMGMFEPETITLVSGAQTTIPNGFVSAPMETNPVPDKPFMDRDTIEQIGLPDFLDTLTSILGSKDYVPNFIYTTPGGSVDVGDGTPPILTFSDTINAAIGGWGINYLEATSAKADHMGRKRGIQLNQRTLPYHKKLVETHRHYAAVSDQKLMIQLTHAGWCAQQPLTFRDVFGRGANPPTRTQINQVLDDITSSGYLAVDAGYDGVDIKLCHGYGLADWALHLVRGATNYQEAQEKLAPIINVFQNIRNYAVSNGRPEFMVGFRFSFFEGVQNGWGARFNPDFNGSIGYSNDEAERQEQIDMVMEDYALSETVIMALAPFADFYHNSNGIPAVTKGLGRGTKNDCPNSHILHWATSKQAYNVIQGAKERGLITHSPLVIASNLTTATASGEPVEGNYHILQALGSNRRNGSGVRYGSYGRESMANTNLPNDIKNLGPDMEYKERCARCSICSEPLIDQERAGGCVKNPVVQGIYRAHNRAKRQLAK